MKRDDPIEKRVKSYRLSYKKDFGKKLDPERAYDSLFSLVGFVKVLQRIDKRLELEKQLKNSPDFGTIKTETTNNTQKQTLPSRR